jgi:hypothetical protein
MTNVKSEIEDVIIDPTNTQRKIREFDKQLSAHNLINSN